MPKKPGGGAKRPAARGAKQATKSRRPRESSAAAGPGAGANHGLPDGVDVPQLLHDIASGVSAETGEDFFQSLVQYLCKSARVDHAFVGELSGGADRTVNTISVCVRGRKVSNFRYSLAHTPSENVVIRGFCTYPRDVQKLFPRDRLLSEMGVESYAGAPLRSTDGEVLGILVVMDSKPLHDPAMAEWLLRIFAARAVAELERRRTESALRASEERFRLLAENARDVIYRYRLHPVRAFEYVSPSVTVLTGYTPEEHYADPELGLKIVHPDDRAALEALLAAPETFFGKTLTIRWVHKNGSLLWSELNGSPIHDADGRLIAVQGIARDVTERTRAEQQAAHLGRVLENSLDEIYMFDARSLRFVQVNEGARRNLGYSMDELRHMTPLDLKPEFTPERFEELIAPLRRCQRDMIIFETVHRRKDGSLYPVEVRLHCSRGGDPSVFVAMITDISARRKANEEMQKLSQATEQTADGVMITDRVGRLEYVNPAFEKITGYTRAEALGRTPRLLHSGKHDRDFYRRLWATILAGETFREVFINRRKDGSLYHEDQTITPLKDGAGRITHFISTGRDITERIAAEERLQYLAHHDALTELPNRILFMDRLQRALVRAQRNQRLVAVMFMDLDEFKEINDAHGHPVGDELLRALAARLSECMRQGDTVSRLGGDEFAILLEDISQTEHTLPVADKVLNALALPFVLDPPRLTLTTTTSIGISLYPRDGQDGPTLLKNADAAMYRAKERGKNNYQFYSLPGGKTS